MFFSLIKELNRLISKGMSKIYHWEKLTFSKLRFSQKNFFEEMHWLWRAKRWKVYSGKRLFWHYRLSSMKPCLRFLLICFVREIKDFYQSFLENEIDFMNIMNVSPNILAKNCRWKGNDYNDIMIFLSLKNACTF